MVPTLHADHAEDEGDTAPGEHGARRPDDLTRLAKGPGHFDHGTGHDGGKDLWDRHPKPKSGLPEDVDGDDDTRQMKPGVTEVGKNHRIVGCPETNGASSGRRHAGRLPHRRRPRVTG